MFTTAQVRSTLWSAFVLVPMLLSGSRASKAPLRTTTIYFPIVSRYLPVELVQEPIGCYIFPLCSIPHSRWVAGTVENLTSTPLYSVILEVDVVVTNCFEQPCSTTTFTERFTPAFAATLPNQINPFQTSKYLEYKMSYELGQVRVVDARPAGPDDPVYHALTVVRSHRDGSSVSGVVRNDSGRVMHEGRVVVFTEPSCWWEEATLDSSTLQPGQETAFHLGEYHCSADTPLVLGQGLIESRVPARRRQHAPRPHQAAQDEREGAEEPLYHFVSRSL